MFYTKYFITESKGENTIIEWETVETYYELKYLNETNENNE